ncbi:hypothetical protein DRJ17_03050 [Candidatus Woesearchaeota archaeon]|nr:MAG: hypothetical protein DRJ17_03050 [Candidatus Woesearchaeota archaeon]
MKNIHVVLVLVIIGAILLSACTTTHTLNSQETIKTLKIGIITPLTGWGAYWGVPVINGAEIAKDKISSEGMKLDLYIEDSKANGKETVMAAKKLINIDKIDAAIVDFSMPSLAVAPVFKDEKTPFVYVGYVKSILEENDYAFKSFLDVESDCKKMVRYAKVNNKTKKLGAILAQTEYSHLCLKGAKEIEPNINEYWYNFGDTDFKPLFTKAKDDGVDTIIIVGWTDEFVPFFQQMVEMDIDFNILCGSGSECVPNEVLKNIPEETLQRIITFDLYGLEDTDFAKKYNEKHPNASKADLVAAAYGYDEVIILAEAAKHCNPVTKDCIKEHLLTIKDYPTALNSNGFKDRVLQIKTKLYNVKDRKLSVLE